MEDQVIHDDFSSPVMKLLFETRVVWFLLYYCAFYTNELI